MRASLIPAGALSFVLLLAPAPAGAQRAAADSLALERVLAYPFPSGLTASPSGSRIAWVFNQQGRRNIWTADAPDYAATPLTHYDADDGQELTGVAVSADGSTIVYARGGDHDANWDVDTPPDPLSSTEQPKIQIWAVSTRGGEPRLLADGDEPVLSPKGDRVVFSRAHQLWVVPTDGSSPARQLFYARGDNRSPVWSPDGSRLAFVSDRGDHRFIGVYAPDSAGIRWMAPSTSRDGMPRWSPDGSRLAFTAAGSWIRCWRRIFVYGSPEPN